MSVKKMSVLLGVLVVVSMVLTACPAPQPQVIEKIVTQEVVKEVKVIETREVEKVIEKPVEVVKEVAAEDYTTPHPILSDARVRQAIAHCINRDELIASVYPYVEDKAGLRMDSWPAQDPLGVQGSVPGLSVRSRRRPASYWTRPAGS